MKGYKINIERKTIENENFREVLHTEQHNQLVVMSLLPNEDIGKEIHQVTDQFIRIEQGSAKSVLDGEERMLTTGDAIVIPAGVEHNIINTSSEEKLKLYTIYSPPHHKDKTIHKTKQDADNDTQDHI